MNLVAFSLLQGTTGPAFYAAIRNDGNAPSCNAGMMTDFIDKSGQTVASVGRPLLSKQFYRLHPTSFSVASIPVRSAWSPRPTFPPRSCRESWAA